MTSEKHIRLIWVSFALLFGLVLGFFIFKPFLPEIFLAMVLAVISYPLYKKLKRNVKKDNLAALITTILVLLVVIIPISLIGGLVVKESISFASSLDTRTVGINDAIVRFDNLIADKIPIYKQGTISVEKTGVYIENGLKWVAENVQGLFANIISWIISIAILSLSLFYLLKDGHKLYEGVLYTSPLADTIDKKIGKEVASIMRAVVSGRIIVGITQGFVAYLGFKIFGIGDALLLAVITSIIAILPLIGPMLVIVPISVYELVTGMYYSGIGLLLWGIFIVGLIDNIIGPIFIHSKTNIHPFVVLVAVLGGVQLFGIVGFVAGPVVVGIIYALFRVLPVTYRESREY